MAFDLHKCPVCKNSIGIPENIKGMNIKFGPESNGIKITCAKLLPNKKRNALLKCKGFIFYKPKSKK